jgi:hypothetical protein
MLTDDQFRLLWEHLIASETRALYFADLTTRTTRRRQTITALTFLLSSGAVATLVAALPARVAIVQGLIVAGLSAYAMAANLDGRVATLAKLHATWQALATAYEQLWQHTDDADAEGRLDGLIAREAEPSTTAATSAPYDVPLLDLWESRVFAMRHLQA